VPFHYGYWDRDGEDGRSRRRRAANELTVTSWDPVSKQPTFKTAKARVVRLRRAGGPSPAPELSAPPVAEAP
jgi:hypothetical protein